MDKKDSSLQAGTMVLGTVVLLVLGSTFVLDESRLVRWLWLDVAVVFGLWLLARYGRDCQFGLVRFLQTVGLICHGFKLYAGGWIEWLRNNKGELLRQLINPRFAWPKWSMLREWFYRMIKAVRFDFVSVLKRFLVRTVITIIIFVGFVWRIGRLSAEIIKIIIVQVKRGATRFIRWFLPIGRRYGLVWLVILLMYWWSRSVWQTLVIGAIIGYRVYPWFDRLVARLLILALISLAVLVAVGELKAAETVARVLFYLIVVRITHVLWSMHDEDLRLTKQINKDSYGI
ncbi:MAG: hypothetical protein V1707_00430 [bacterium]